MQLPLSEVSIPSRMHRASVLTELERISLQTSKTYCELIHRLLWPGTPHFAQVVQHIERGLNRLERVGDIAARLGNVVRRRVLLNHVIVRSTTRRQHHESGDEINYFHAAGRMKLPSDDFLIIDSIRASPMLLR